MQDYRREGAAGVLGQDPSGGQPLATKVEDYTFYLQTLSAHRKRAPGVCPKQFIRRLYTI